MLDLIDQSRSRIEQLCRAYSVKTLEVFGSAARNDWDPNQSDLDFLVDFLPLEPGHTLDAILGSGLIFESYSDETWI